MNSWLARDLLWIIFICWGKCSWIIKLLLVWGDIILWVTGLMHCNVWLFVSLLYARWDKIHGKCKVYPPSPQTFIPNEQCDSTVNPNIEHPLSIYVKVYFWSVGQAYRRSRSSLSLSDRLHCTLCVYPK